MICPYCREIIDDDSNFCDHCGRPLDKKKSEPEKKKKKKWPIVLAAVLAFLVIVAAVVLLILKPWKADAFETYIRQGDAGNAVTYYEENISGKAEKEESAKKFLSDYLSDTLKAYESGDSSQEDWNSAYETVKKADKSLNLVSDELTAAKDEALAVEASKENYQKGQECLKNKQYLDAGAALAQVIEEDSENYSDAQKDLEGMKENYMSELKKTAESYVKDEKYDDVAALLADAQAIYGETDDLSDLKNSTLAEQYEKIIDEAIENADFGAVVAAYQEGHVTLGIVFDDAFTGKVEGWIRDNATTGARDAADKYNFEAAFGVVDEALAAMPEDETLTALRAELVEKQEKAPVWLVNCVAVESQDIRMVTEPVKDVWENTYDNVIEGEAFGAKVSYHLGGEYKTLTGIIYPNTKDTSSVFGFIIYGDGNELLSATVNGGAAPEEISVDISGVNDIAIVINGEATAPPCLANAMLWKE